MIDKERDRHTAVLTEHTRDEVDLVVDKERDRHTEVLTEHTRNEVDLVIDKERTDTQTF